MAEGYARRQRAADNLAGQQDMEPVMLQGPAVQAPTQIRGPQQTTQSRIMDQLSKWGGSKVQQAAKAQQKRDLMEGQMAYQQGKTLEQIEMGGNKWALEGYRLMDAQTVSSSMLAAQREEISQGDYELDPDAYRERYVNRVEGATQDLDERTADLVRQQMTEQMAPLIAEHTTAHMRHREQQNYDSLERSIDIVSRDPTATEQLVDFARGEADSASAGLSNERRQAATVSGVVRAFDNDNPIAYSALKREGLLGDSLSSKEQNQIRAARNRFESRRRQEYNEELLAGEQALMRTVEQGELEPSEAVEQLSVLYADHDIRIQQAEAGALYQRADTASRAADLTRGNLITEAGLRGDTRQQADIIFDSLVGTESSGVSTAHRTNVDGREYGGLIQMGQARLNETLDAMGRDRMSVREYKNLSKAEQREIGVSHLEDLVRAADATGAVGSTINGVTVTMSGLVAVGHLGGAAGMRRFVESAGEYNPQDELGTSLTDYLSKHASGERTELMSANERLKRSQNILTQTRERLAIDKYEQMAPQLYDLDRQFKHGGINYADWMEQRRGLYEEYDRARTEADVNHEISTLKAVDQRMASDRQATIDEQYKADMERAEIELAPVRQTWENAISDPAATPADIRQANAAYSQARADIHDKHGIAFVDQGNAGVAEEIVTRTSEAFEQWGTRQEENTLIEAAVRGRYVDELPQNLRDRAFDDHTSQLKQTYSREVAEGRMTEDEAQEAMSQDLNTFYAQSGAVPEDVRRHANGMMQNEWVDKDGNPSGAVVDVVQQYQQIKSMNPAAANKFLSEKQRLRAEAVLSRSAGNPNLLGEAVRNIGLESKNDPLREDPHEYVRSEAVQTEIRSTVKDFIRSEDFFLGSQAGDMNASGKETLYSPETQEALTEELEAEVQAAKKAMPNLKPEDLVAHAADRLDARTAIIGGDPVILPTGQDVGTMFFGSRAPDFMNNGSVNSAVMEWLRSDEARARYPELDTVTTGEFFHPIIQQGLDKALGAVPFTNWGFDPAMGNEDWRSTLDTGVRPFRTFPQPNGTIGVRYLRPDGNYSEAITIPAREAGDLYIKRRQREAIQ